MWVLEAEGEVLQGENLLSRLHAILIRIGRRIWLRPGKKFLFGRTSAEGMAVIYTMWCR